jgi:hypothetical protein
MKISKILVGLIIAFLGVILLLNNFGILNWSVWLIIGKLWPVLLILIGILLFFDNSLLPLGIVLLMGVLIFVLTVPHTSTSNLERTGNYKQSWQLEPEVEEAELKVDFGAGALNLKESTGKMVEFDLNYTGEEPKVKYEAKGDKVKYQVKPVSNFIKGFSQASSRDWNLFLSPEVVWDIDFDTGAAKANLDLSQLKLRKIDIESGAAEVLLSLGDNGMETQLDIDAGVSKIKVIVPESVKLKVRINGALNNSNLEAAGLIPSGDYYVTPADLESDSMVKITLDTGVSDFELVRQ